MLIDTGQVFNLTEIFKLVIILNLHIKTSIYCKLSKERFCKYINMGLEILGSLLHELMIFKIHVHG